MDNVYIFQGYYYNTEKKGNLSTFPHQDCSIFHKGIISIKRFLYSNISLSSNYNKHTIPFVYQNIFLSHILNTQKQLNYSIRLFYILSIHLFQD